MRGHVSVHAYLVGSFFLTCLKYNTSLRTFDFFYVPCREGKENLAMKELFKIQSFDIKSFISSSEASAFDFALQSDPIAAFWLFSFLTNDAFQHILFFRAFPFLDFGTVPS